MVSGSARRFAVGISFVISLCGVLAFGAASAASAAVYYVVPGGATSGTCGSWGSGCELSYALTQATSSGDQVWVEKGVYTPGTSQSDTFAVSPGAAVYGGFAGTETALSERDPAANVTVLSGDIDNNDTNTDGNNIDETTADILGSNSYTVVTMDGTLATKVLSSTVLDGFTVTGGNNTTTPRSGGGLYCNGSGSGHECSPTLANVTFSGNSARYGGAIFNYGAFSGTSSPTLTNVTFSGNSAAVGGAIWNEGSTAGVSSPVLTNVTFSGNSAGINGGAIDNEGYQGTSSPTLTNVTFSGNSAGIDGGAIYNFGDSGTSSPTLTNVILWDDSASGTTPNGPEIYNVSATPAISYSVVQGGNAGSSLNGGPDTAFSSGTGNLSSHPLLGPLQNNGGSTETMALLPGSSAIDAGDDAACPATDQRGVARPQDGDGNGTAICDIGAYEALPPVTAIPALSFQGLALLGLLLAAGALGLLRRS